MSDLAAINPRTRSFVEWMKANSLNANKVSRACGVPYNTILDFVKGRTFSLMDTTATQIASAYGLSVEDIFAYGSSGALTAKAKRTIPVLGYVGAASEFFGFNDHEQGFGLDVIEAPPGVPDSAVAVIVRGDSGYPAIRDGMVLIYWNKLEDPSSVEGEDCFVQLEDGRTLVKILERGTEPGLWTLMSMNAATQPIRNVKIEWAAPIEIRLRKINWRPAP